MKKIFLIAIAVGALISAALMIIDPLVDFALLSWQMPGVSAAYLFWGAIGGAASMGIAIAWFVNAVVYAAPTFAFLIIFKMLAPALRSKQVA